MKQANKKIYCPALRMKSGELAGVSALADDIAGCTLPRFIIPPRGERNGFHNHLFVIDEQPDVSFAMSRHWRNRHALLDFSYIIDECGRERMEVWMPGMFDRARNAGVIPIPLVMFRDLDPSLIAALQGSLASDYIRLGICVDSGQMVDTKLNNKIMSFLEKLKISPSQCAVIADFSGTELSNPFLAAPIITQALQQLQEIGQWGHIIFQGTHYPETNPAAHDDFELWPRHEWNAWRAAVKFDPSTAEHFMFGDYAADCAKMNFSTTGARAIRHLRYTTDEGNWLIQRGSKTGTDQEIMRTICGRIVNSKYFSGSDFSEADTQILRIARGFEGPGNAKIWRQINTTHHITRVVTDIAPVRSVPIRVRATNDSPRQLTLLPE